jgi:hypothetical protein
VRTTPGTKLIHEDGHEVKVGDEVTTFRGEKAVVTGWVAPLHAASTGRVHIKFVHDVTSAWSGHEGEFFPSVIDTHIVYAD